MMKETWVDINGFEGFYKVSNLGRVKSLNRIIKAKRNGIEYFIPVKGKIMKLIIGNHGYWCVKLMNTGKFKNMTVHRLIALHFISNPENKAEVNHINSIRSDNSLKNLEWVTRQENQLHSYRTTSRRGFYAGTKNHPSRLKSPIIQKTLDGYFVKEWVSLADITRSGIYNVWGVLKNKQGHHHAGGYLWEYKYKI